MGGRTSAHRTHVKGTKFCSPLALLLLDDLHLQPSAVSYAISQADWESICGRKDGVLTVIATYIDEDGRWCDFTHYGLSDKRGPLTMSLRELNDEWCLIRERRKTRRKKRRQQKVAGTSLDEVVMTTRSLTIPRAQLRRLVSAKQKRKSPG